MDKFKDGIFILLEKIKGSKKLKTVLIIGILLLMFLIGYKYLQNNKEEEKISESNQYASSIEKKLESTIKSINGINTVSVNISLETGFEYIYATNDEVKTTSSGSLSSSDIVLVSGEPIVVKEIYPKIQGVVVVINEVDLKTRFEVLQAIQTVLEIDNDKITIIS